MLFIQGSRDPFGTPSELRTALEPVASPLRIHAIEGGDHSFRLAPRDAARQAAAHGHAEWIEWRVLALHGVLHLLGHDHEIDAFRAFARQYPDATLLVDTYDTLRGVDHVIALARELGPAFRIRQVRLDSGDLAALAGSGLLTQRQRVDAGISIKPTPVSPPIDPTQSSSVQSFSF